MSPLGPEARARSSPPVSRACPPPTCQATLGPMQDDYVADYIKLARTVTHSTVTYPFAPQVFVR